MFPTWVFFISIRLNSHSQVDCERCPSLMNDYIIPLSSTSNINISLNISHQFLHQCTFFIDIFTVVKKIIYDVLTFFFRIHFYFSVHNDEENLNRNVIERDDNDIEENEMEFQLVMETSLIFFFSYISFWRMKRGKLRSYKWSPIGLNSIVERYIWLEFIIFITIIIFMIWDRYEDILWT